MKYVVRPRKNPQDLDAAPKYYLQAKLLGTKTLSDICTEISLSSSLTRGDVVNTIMSFLDTIPKYLMMGYSVKLDELGTLRLSLNSYPSDTLEEATGAKVKAIHPVFTASPQLRESILNTPVELFPEVEAKKA